MARLHQLAAMAAAAVACACEDGRAAAPAMPGQSAAEETRAANVPSQRPAFAGQTRAPRLTTDTDFRVVTVAQGLDYPWSLAFLPDGRMLVSERPGRLRIVDGKGRLSAPLAGVPEVARGGQLGLFGLALDPQFGVNHRVYLAYAAPAGDGSQLTVARAELADGARGLGSLQVIFRAQPIRSGTANIGGRIAFAADGSLFVTVGDRFQSRDLAQMLDNHLGKLIRINPDGSIPKGNPFVGRPGARPEVWSLGHRNPLSLAVNPWTRQIWEVEHGAKGGDELNIPLPGRNYGWPVITYGEDYSGRPIGAGVTQQAGLEQPAYYWDPVIAPSGMAFYDASLFPSWRGSLFIGGLGSEHLARLTLKGDRVAGEEWLLADLGERFRDVQVGPDGAVYVLTDNPRGRILKLVPR